MTGIVFDFDGVLAQSMENHAEAYRRILAPYGIEVEDRDVFLREGARSETIIRDLLAEADLYPPDEKVARLADEKQAIFRGLPTPILYEGAEAAVEAARVTTPHVGLVTGTRRENLEALAPHLLPSFRAVMAQEDYSHDKPHPEPYAKAAAALGQAPEDCIAVENALRGVTSAKAAGYGVVVAIATTLSPTDFEDSEADVLVTDHEALREFLAGLPSS